MGKVFFPEVEPVLAGGFAESSGAKTVAVQRVDCGVGGVTTHDVSSLLITLVILIVTF